MSAKLLLIYFAIILACTVAGFLAGQYLQNIVSVFLGHQDQMYYDLLPKLTSLNKPLVLEIQKVQLQFISFMTTVCGFVLGASLITRSRALS